MEYPKREKLQSELYEALKKTLVQHYQGLFDVRKKEDEGELLVKKLYLEPQEGCVPEEFIGDELLYSIKAKYYEFFSVIRDRLQAEYLEKRKIHHPPISIYVDTSYEDTTSVVVSFQNLVLFTHHSKAWNFIWSSKAELQKELTELYYKMRDRLNEYFLEGVRYEKETNENVI